MKIARFATFIKNDNMITAKCTNYLWHIDQIVKRDIPEDAHVEMKDMYKRLLLTLAFERGRKHYNETYKRYVQLTKLVSLPNYVRWHTMYATTTAMFWSYKRWLSDRTLIKIIKRLNGYINDKRTTLRIPDYAFGS